MSFDTTFGDGPALLRALRVHQQRELREAIEARHLHRLVTAAGIDPQRLSGQAQRTLAWLCGWDNSTVAGRVGCGLGDGAVGVVLGLGSEVGRLAPRPEGDQSDQRQSRRDRDRDTDPGAEVGGRRS